jgi:hypothetical protein
MTMMWTHVNKLGQNWTWRCAVRVCSFA